MDQLRVPLQPSYQLIGALTHLFQRIAFDFDALWGADSRSRLIYFLDGIQFPVLHLQQQQTACRMQDNEVGISLSFANRQLVPAEVVLLQMVL